MLKEAQEDALPDGLDLPPEEFDRFFALWAIWVGLGKPPPKILMEQPADVVSGLLIVNDLVDRMRSQMKRSRTDAGQDILHHY